MNAVAVLEQQRPRLFAIAYRMLGSVAGAEDVVQETWLLCQRAPRATVQEPADLPDQIPTLGHLHRVIEREPPAGGDGR